MSNYLIRTLDTNTYYIRLFVVSAANIRQANRLIVNRLNTYEIITDIFEYNEVVTIPQELTAND